MKIQFTDLLKILTIDKDGICNDDTGRPWVQCSCLSFFDEEENYISLVAYGYQAEMIMNNHTGGNMRRAFVTGTMEINKIKTITEKRKKVNGKVKIYEEEGLDIEYRVTADNIRFIDRFIERDEENDEDEEEVVVTKKVKRTEREEREPNRQERRGSKSNEKKPSKSFVTSGKTMIDDDDDNMFEELRGNATDSPFTEDGDDEESLEVTAEMFEDDYVAPKNHSKKPVIQSIQSKPRTSETQHYYEEEQEEQEEAYERQRTTAYKSNNYKKPSNRRRNTYGNRRR